MSANDPLDVLRRALVEEDDLRLPTREEVEEALATVAAWRPAEGVTADHANALPLSDLMQPFSQTAQEALSTAGLAVKPDIFAATYEPVGTPTGADE